MIKVGGALLTGAAQIRRLAAAVAARHRRGERLLVVASALQGVTDLIDAACRRAVAGRSPEGDGALGTVERLRRQHEELGGLGEHRESAEPGAPAEGVPPPPEIEPLLAELARRLAAVRRRGALDERERARLLSFGERLSAPLLAAAVAAAGAPARAVDAEDAGLKAAGPPGDGVCDLAASAPGFAALGVELARRVVVLTGFYGVDAHGDVVLFGRGGTDYTAGAAAAGLGAADLEFWKDTPGILSADPRLVPAARLVAELSFAEVARLGSFGVRVLHPRCLDPLRGRAPRIVVRAGGNGEGDGACTRLVERRLAPSPRVMVLALGRAPAEIGLVGEGVAGDGAVRARVRAHLAALGVRSAPLVGDPCGTALRCAVHRDDLERGLVGLHERLF